MALLPAIAGRYVDGHARARAISTCAGQNVVVLGGQRDLLYHLLEVALYGPPAEVWVGDVLRLDGYFVLVGGGEHFRAAVPNGKLYVATVGMKDTFVAEQASCAALLGCMAYLVSAGVAAILVELEDRVLAALAGHGMMPCGTG
eukprot:347212-Chlamydomonas_euryale.AAC.1